MSFKNLIKKLFGKNNNIEKSIITSLNFGDIIYAKSYYTEDETAVDNHKHFIRPYIVITTDKGKIIGCPCTHSEYDNDAFEIGANYNLFTKEKKSYGIVENCIKAIDKKAFINVSNKNINSTDKMILSKKIVLNNNLTYDDNGITKPLNFKSDLSLDINDVVYYNDRYYVIVDKNNDNYNLILLKNYNPHHSNIDFSQTTVDYANNITKKGSELVYVNYIPDKQMKIIDYCYKDHLENKKFNESFISNSNINRGCLLQSNQLLYYVYGITGDTANTFLVDNLIENISIKINGKEFRPLFDTTKDFNIKSNSYRIITMANDKEMDYIKDCKKNYSKPIKKEIKNINKHVKLSVGDIIFLKKDFNKHYLITEKNHSELTVIALNDLLQKNKVKYLSVDSSYYQRCKNITSIELAVIKRKLRELNFNNEIINILEENEYNKNRI